MEWEGLTEGVGLRGVGGADRRGGAKVCEGCVRLIVSLTENGNGKARRRERRCLRRMREQSYYLLHHFDYVHGTQS